MIIIMNPFIPNAPFFYPLKTSEKEKGCIGNKWLNNNDIIRKYIYIYFSFPIFQSVSHYLYQQFMTCPKLTVKICGL